MFGPLTDSDRQAIAEFEQFLRDEHDKESNEMRPDSNQSILSEAADLDSVAGWVFVLRQIAAQRETLDETEAKAREQIQAVLGDRTVGQLDGEDVIRWSHTAGARRFDRKRFEKDHPNLAAQYLVRGEPGRRFELIKPKDGAQ